MRSNELSIQQLSETCRLCRQDRPMHVGALVLTPGIRRRKDSRNRVLAARRSSATAFTAATLLKFCDTRACANSSRSSSVDAAERMSAVGRPFENDFPYYAGAASPSGMSKSWGPPNFKRTFRWARNSGVANSNANPSDATCFHQRIRGPSR